MLVLVCLVLSECPTDHPAAHVLHVHQLIAGVGRGGAVPVLKTRHHLSYGTTFDYFLITARRRRSSLRGSIIPHLCNLTRLLRIML